jgi:hypothetical protein
VSVFAANGDTIFGDCAIAYAADQKTRSDCELGVGFSGVDRDLAVKMVAEQDANAKLIAAAPDLLAACQGAEKLLSKQLEEYNATLAAVPGLNSPPGPVLNALRGAIAKATT